jgi:hypothetical protein
MRIESNVFFNTAFPGIISAIKRVCPGFEIPDAPDCLVAVFTRRQSLVQVRKLVTCVFSYLVEWQRVHVMKRPLLLLLVIGHVESTRRHWLKQIFAHESEAAHVPMWREKRDDVEGEIFQLVERYV